VDGEGLPGAALGQGTPFAVPGFRSSAIRDRTSIISITFCTTGVYGITNAWAGGLCEPPAFFCGARAFRPPAAAPSDGQRRAVARGRLPGLRRRPVEAFRPRRIRHDHRHRACPIGWKRGEAGGTGGGARRSPGEHGAHRGNCAGAIAFPVSAPPASPGLVLNHRLELTAEPLVKGFRGLGGGEVRRRTPDVSLGRPHANRFATSVYSRSE
jgi:hypothetical protein